MSIDKVKIIAEIVKIGSEIYGTLVDKDLAKKNDEKDRKISILETEVSSLKARLEQLEKK